MSTPHTLLFVDDEENILKALVRLFHRTGHQLLAALGGPQALEILRTQPVSLIVSDQRMPGMTGAQFLAEARVVQPDAVRIMLTGYSDVQAAMAAINAGQVFRFLAKPWDDEALVATVSEALAGIDLRREHAELQAVVQRRNDELQELNASLERKVVERTNEIQMNLWESEALNKALHQQNLATVKTLAGLLDLRSPALGAHCRRVAALVPGMCSRLEIRERPALQALVTAALLHDLGKIGYPDAVLIKDPSHVGHQERTELRKHPVIGQGQLQSVESLNEVGRLIRHHHENWDGSGYPDGLSGKDIPLGAQVLRVLDAYDNLTRGRPTSETQESLWVAGMDRQVSHSFSGTVFKALLETLDASRKGYDPTRERKVRVAEIEEGMVLTRDFRAQTGVLLVARDEVLRSAYIDKIRNMSAIYALEEFAYVKR